MMPKGFMHLKPKKILTDLLSSTEGFTMTEIIVGLALASVIITAMISVFSSLSQSYTTQNVAAGVQQATRTGIDYMIQNIRMAGFNPFRLTEVGIKDDISKSSFHFSYDEDEDGTIANKEDITFKLESGTLRRITKGGNSEPLIENVSDLEFTYLDINDDTTSNPIDIRAVEVSMTVSEAAGRERKVSRTYSTRVICRNMGL